MAYDLVARLRIKDEGFERTMKRAANATSMLEKTVGQSNNAIDRMTRVAGSAGGAFSRLSSAAGTAMTRVRSSIISTSTTVAGLGAAVAGAAASWAAFSTTRSGLRLSSDAEQTAIAFETMLGSAEKSQKFLANLKDFAENTPFDLPQLINASRRLVGFGFAAESVIPMLTSVGDAASGLGAGRDGIDRITLALAQIRSNGRVMGDEMNQLTDVGIPAWDILAEKMKISTAQVRELSEKGLIPANKAIRALLEGMDKRYGGMMEKQAKTLDGMRNKIQEVWDNDIIKRYGDGIATALYPRFKRLTEWIDNNGDTIERWGNTTARVAEKAANSILQRFEGAYKYIQDHFVNNESFNRLNTFDAKVDFIFNDLLASFNKWYAETGRTHVQKVASSITDTLTTALANSTGQLTQIGFTLGGGIAAGIADGFAKGAKNIPVVGSIIRAGGDLYTGISDLIKSYETGGVTGLADKYVANVKRNFSTPITDEFGNYLDDSTPPWMKAKIDGSHATGLDRVPYDGYRAILHKDERVQTKSEADNYRSGRQSPSGVIITGNTFNIRQESDIDAIARALAKELEAVHG
ncbi:tape measure protein [Paenibacillus naphthalenovorans]|uniref:tape measure protein n=1 Tax=Paenibacillus naphthalenovorans TaxID=162209 RepID=UPI003D2884DD